MDNASNLATDFIKEITAAYAGTRLGRQELDGEILEDYPGALWTRAMLDGNRAESAPANLARVVVAVDPSGNDGTSDDLDPAGIVVAGVATDDPPIGYALDDWTMRGSPNEWGRRAIQAFHRYEADLIVAEGNYGGEMVKTVIRSIDPNVPVKLVSASRGKHVRAEPVSSLMEQGRIRHVGSFAELEDELCMMTSGGYAGTRSPNRADAYVWAFSELFGILSQRKVAMPARPSMAGHGQSGWLRL
jgi:phage terminase large subunit-like protein